MKHFHSKYEIIGEPGLDSRLFGTDPPLREDTII